MKDNHYFLVYDEKLSNSGMSTPKPMKSVAEAGVELVVNLAAHDVPNAIPKIWDEDAYFVWKMFLEDAMKRSADVN